LFGDAKNFLSGGIEILNVSKLIGSNDGFGERISNACDPSFAQARQL
jgi:hypothetical protein